MTIEDDELEAKTREAILWISLLALGPAWRDCRSSSSFPIDVTPQTVFPDLSDHHPRQLILSSS